MSKHDYIDDDAMILHGDAIVRLREFTARTAHTCITSPPYFGLRDYGSAEQIGLEQTPAEYVQRLVQVFREVRRVLRDDGTLWLNLGDSYSSMNSGCRTVGMNARLGRSSGSAKQGQQDTSRPVLAGMKPKDMLGMPWRVAFALQDDGWFLRSDIIWHKPNPMPESVTDRPTKAHEYLFLLAKSQRYYYDGAAIKEPHQPDGRRQTAIASNGAGVTTHENYASRQGAERWPGDGRNRRSVWTVPTRPYVGAHFATFPPDLIKPCILAGSPEGGIVLDPFMGSGTTAHTARRLQRSSIGTELNEGYIALAADRLSQGSLFASGAR